MNTDANSLDNLHDLVPPPGISWWPMAPGWQVLCGLILLLVIILFYQAWRRWKANAYRRAALRELKSLHDATTVAELLRRTALAIAPRSVIAEKTGSDWIAWLTSQCPGNMPDTVREQITTGLYQPSQTNQDLTALRDYTAHWISSHKKPAC